MTQIGKLVPAGAVVLEFVPDLNVTPDPASLVRDIRNVAALEARHHACTENPALEWLADQIEAQTKPPRFTLGQRVRYIGTDNDYETWVLRRDRQHVGIVVQILDNDCVRVWDTVENEWWMADSPQLETVEDQS